MKDKRAKKRQIFILCALMTLVSIFGGASFAKRPKNVYLTIDNKQMKLYTAMPTVRKALEEEGYTHLEGAISNVDLDTAVSDEMLVNVNMRKTIHMIDGGVEKLYQTYTNTVGDFLRENQITYGAEDQVSPACQTELEDGQTIRLDRYETATEEEEVTVEHESEVKKSDFLFAGQTVVSQKGQDGLHRVTKEVVYKNGQVFQTKILEDETLKEPVTEITLEGTANRSAAKGNSLANGEVVSLAYFLHKGVIPWNGYVYTYYSQRVLPGRGLNIPGRHINERGYVVDANGFIVLAGSAPRGTVYPTPFGYYGKIYDHGTSGNHLDVYIR